MRIRESCVSFFTTGESYLQHLCQVFARSWAGCVFEMMWVFAKGAEEAQLQFHFE